MNKHMQNIRRALTTLGIATILMTGACSKQEFRKTEFSGSASAPGGRSLPAKVDIVIVVDNSASVNNVFHIVKNQLAQFTSNLRDQYWDFHLARMNMVPLGANDPNHKGDPQDLLQLGNPFNKILVNPDFNNATLPDGSPNPEVILVPSSAAETDLNQFPVLEAGDITNMNGQDDYTYKVLYNSLLMAKQTKVNNFFREDALLAVIVITDGAEKSVDPNHSGQLAIHDTGSPLIFQNGLWEADSLEEWGGLFKGLKPARSDLLQFYPIAASGAHPNGNIGCLIPGGTSFIGTSYTQLLNSQLLGNFLNGLATNFCDNNALSGVLSRITSHLEIIKEDYIFSNIVLAVEPIPGSIHFFKNGREIPKDPINGWTFVEGGRITVPTVTGIRDKNGGRIPFNLFYRTGWVIALHGDAELLGSDTFDVDFNKP